MSYYDNIHAEISKLEKLRKDIIDALKYVDVDVPGNTTFDELPNYVMKIGGVDTTGWPIDMSSIGYTAEDSRRACYRYICKLLDTSSDRGFLNFENLKMNIQTEMVLSKQKMYEWDALSDKTSVSGFFDGWKGKFPPMLDTSTNTNFSLFFAHSSCVHFPLYDTSNAVNIHGIFHWCNTPHEIPEFDFKNANTFEIAYGGSLWDTYIFSPKNIGVTPPTSYYTMLGMLASGAGGWWWSPFFYNDRPTGGCLITNKIIYRPYLISSPLRRSMFEVTPNIMASEGFDGLDVQEFNFRSSTGDLSYTATGTNAVCMSRNSFMNIANSMVDATAAFYPDYISEGVMRIYTRQDFASYKIRTHEETWNESPYDTNNLRCFGHGYYTYAELAQWESTHGSILSNERNLREFLLTTGHFSTPEGERLYDSRFPYWKITDSEVELQFSSTAEGVFFVVPLFHVADSIDVLDYDRYINGTDNIIFRKPFSFARVLHDSNKEGSVIPRGNTPGEGGKRVIYVAKYFWNNVLTQEDRNLVLYKGYDVYHPE